MPFDLISLLVDDYDTAIEFLTETLGFTLVEDSASTSSDGTPKRWVVVRHGGAGAGLLLSRASSPEQRDTVGRQFGGRVGLFLHVDDLDDVLERLIARGCEVELPVREEPYGRVSVVADPWGNRWDLLGPAAG